MDAELVEYELGRAQVPYTTRCVNTREGFLAELAAFQPHQPRWAWPEGDHPTDFTIEPALATN